MAKKNGNKSYARMHEGEEIGKKQKKGKDAEEQKCDELELSFSLHLDEPTRGSSLVDVISKHTSLEDILGSHGN